MAWWVTAGQVVAAAGSAYLNHLRSRDENEQRERDRQEILDAIRQIGNEILRGLTEQELNRQRGVLEGYRDTYAAYDPDPSDLNEENRLVRLSDDSALEIGQIGQVVEDIGNNPRLALDSWPTYVSLIYLRAQAMTERQATYGTVEAKDALPSFNTAIPRLEALLTMLRRRSDAQFSTVVCRLHPDFYGTVCWYQWRNLQQMCGRTSDPTTVERCQRRRDRDMENAYWGYEGVAQISATLEQLRDARDELELVGTLDDLAVQGVDFWSEVVMVNGRYCLPRGFSPERADRLFDAYDSRLRTREPGQRDADNTPPSAVENTDDGSSRNR